MAPPSNPAHPNTELDETAIIARDLIRFDTSNYGGGRSNGELEAAEYVEAHLTALGLAPQLFEPAPRRASVVARVPGRNSAKPALVVHGHLDVVPADPRNWSVDPFAGEIRDGMLWGRGAVDMKNMDAMILAALGDILGSGRQPERDLVVAFFADEESGGGVGAGWLVDNHPELFAGATEAISEVGGYSITVGGRRAYLLQTGEKSLLWVRLVARGTAAHGSRLVGDNAITKLAEAVATLGRTEWPLRLTGTTRELLGKIAEVLGVDPEQVSPDELALATGRRRDSSRRPCAPPRTRPSSRPATSTTSSPITPRRSSTSAPSPAKRRPCSPRCRRSSATRSRSRSCIATSGSRRRRPAPSSTR